MNIITWKAYLRNSYYEYELSKNLATRGLQTAFTADYVLGISIYIHAIVRSFGPLLDTSAIRGKNMKHFDYKKGTSPTTGVARPVYTTVVQVRQVDARS